jgi:hypothetical protein
MIGQEFADVDTCRRNVTDLAIDLHYELGVVKFDRNQMANRGLRKWFWFGLGRVFSWAGLV